MEAPAQETNKIHFSTVLLVGVLVVGLSTAAFLGYVAGYSSVQQTIDALETKLASMSPQNISDYSGANVTYFLDDNVSLSELYAQVKDSVLIVRGIVVQYDIFHRPYYSQVQGSGFVGNVNGQNVVITNYHVVEDAVNITITFAEGDGYAATVLGSDRYEDLAVLSAEASAAVWKPLEIASSSTLEVGDPVIAVGSPYGLAGSMTTGVVSALCRTITEDISGTYPIANIIQTSTPINPGNSGGPLLNFQGQVVGITTAIVSDSQGLGFAVPSNTILREIGSLVSQGSYNQHPSLAATGTDMTIEIAQAMGTNVTYGWLIATASADTGLHGGTSQVSVVGTLVTIGGDIVTAINGTRIMNSDDLASYLEEYTEPGQTVNLEVVRDNQTLSLSVELGTRA